MRRVGSAAGRPGSAISVAFASATLAACGASQPSPDATPSPGPSPSVLVGTVAAQRGTLPTTIEGYGEAAPSANGVATLDVAQAGQVVAVPVVTGARVAAGQAIVVFAVAPSARSAFLQARTALETARKARATTAQLLGQQLATRDQLSQADKGVADAQAALSALAKEGAGATTTVLRAPFAGVVATIPVAPGDRTQPGQALATIARAGALVVSVGVDPSRRGEVRVGAPATLRRLDDGAGAGVAGRVVRVDAALNPKTRQVDVDVGYPAGALLSGEALRVAIETGRVEGWIVPHAAIAVADDGGARVFQVVRGKAHAVPVTVTSTREGRDAVTGPLDPDAAVVVTGAYQLADGDAVRAAGPRGGTGR